MNITVDFDFIELKEPHDTQHICITDGYYFRSGFWMEDGYFIPDPDEPFHYIYWTSTGER